MKEAIELEPYPRYRSPKPLSDLVLIFVAFPYLRTLSFRNFRLGLLDSA